MICKIIMRAVFLTNTGRTHCYCHYQPSDMAELLNKEAFSQVTFSLPFLEMKLNVKSYTFL